MAELPPAVVAVVVATDPGPWFDETLRALAAQDYENLSVLVLVVGGSTDPTAAVAAALPEAFVRRIPDAVGFGAAVNEALTMVEGAPFFLLCHDDCAPAPDAVHVMVEESFRSNAGIVSPKMVHWDDPRALLHVGQNVDKTGAVVERVQEGEIDAGQHDAVRDVFVAPGGCLLVRADLLRAIGGYDATVGAMGEDLDLSWRARIAGARIVVAPSASVRHLGLVASGRRQPLSDAPSLQALQRRHELRTVLICYSWTHLVRVLPQAFALALGEIAAALVAGDGPHARAVVHAWTWNLARGRELRARRRAVATWRVLSDADVRSLQVRGSARLSTYVARLTHQGLAAAHRVRASGEDAALTPAFVTDPVRPERDGGSSLTRPGALAFSEDAAFDELDDLGRRRSGPALRSQRLLATRRARLIVLIAAFLVVVVGSRGLIGTPWPLLGQFVPFPAWTTVWHQFFASWQTAGSGSTAPSSPAFGVLGLLGTVFVGRMGLLQEVMVLGCVPLGTWGMSRLIRPFGSSRARLAAAVAYLALPLAFDALARGRWDGLIAYASMPWVASQLARASGLEPFEAAPTAAGWRRTLAGRVAALGAIEALAVSLAPATVVVVLLCALGIVLGSLAVGGRRAALRAIGAAAGATVVAALLCAPWLVSTLGTGTGALSVLGLPGGASAMPGWGGLLRMAVGPIGSSPLSWLLLGAALAPLLVARGARLAWAARFWAIALLGWLAAIASAKSLAGPFAPSIDVLLAAAAVGVAGAVGLGVAAFETDLAGYRFGWRQGVAVLSIGALGVGLLPAVAEAADGRWGLPVSGYAGSVPLPAVRTSSHAYRVLWLGDPRALPSGGWGISPGLAYATSTDGTPTVADLWPPADPGRAASLAADVTTAMRAETVQMGRLLAAARVRYVVVVTALAPRTPGTQSVPSYPAPVGLVRSIGRQEDLRTVPVSVGGLRVFENTAYRTDGPPLSVLPPGGSARVLDPLGAGAELLAWLVLAAALLGRRRWLDWWWRPLGKMPRLLRSRRRRRRLIQDVVVARDPSALGDPHLVTAGTAGTAGTAVSVVSVAERGEPPRDAFAAGTTPDGSG